MSQRQEGVAPNQASGSSLRGGQECPPHTSPVVKLPSAFEVVSTMFDQVGIAANRF